MNIKWNSLQLTRQSENLRKGERVFLVSVNRLANDPKYVARVVAQELVLTSFGKLQGTGVTVADGRNLRVQLYRRYAVLLRTREEVERYARIAGLRGSLFDHAGDVRCTYSWLVNARSIRPEVRAEGEAKLARMLDNSFTPSYTLTYC